MKNSNFWFLTLCALLVIASVNGWSIPLRIAVVANALVILMDVARGAWKLLKHSEEVQQ